MTVNNINNLLSLYSHFQAGGTIVSVLCTKQDAFEFTVCCIYHTPLLLLLDYKLDLDQLWGKAYQNLPFIICLMVQVNNI